jgi:hypothetical protein
MKKPIILLLSIFTFCASVGAQSRVSDFFNNPDAVTYHLKPYTSFRLGFLGYYSMGMATNLPFGPTAILGAGDNEWKENGKLIMDFSKIADDQFLSEDGAKVNFMFDFNFIDFAWQGKNPGYDKTNKNPNEIYKDWGWGFSLSKISSRLDFGISEDLVHFIGKGNQNDRVVDAAFYMSGSVFEETISGNWHKENFIIPKLYVSIGAAHYIPLVYMPRSEVKATIDTSGENTKITLKGDIQGYTAAKIRDDSFGGMDFGGFDLSLKAEYALFPILDIGISAANIPIVPAHLTTQFTMDFNKTIIDGENFFDDPTLDTDIDTDLKYSSADKWVVRPMRWDLYSLFRPLGKDFLVLKPNIGFTAINPSEETYFNLGLETDLNVTRWFTVSFFTGTYDGLARNRIGLDFNWYVLPIFIYLDMRSQSYLRSWTLKGAAVTFGGAWAF